MDLNARADINFARVDVNFQPATVTQFCYLFFFSFQSTPRFHLYPIQNFSQIYQSYFGEMDLNARVDVIFFRVNVNFQTVTVT